MLRAVLQSDPHASAPGLRRPRQAVGVLVTLALTLGLVLAHARWSRVQRATGPHPGPDADTGWVRALPSTSLVLSTRSRWLRHPYLSEPGAAFQDGPAFLDADPAGALQSPPAALLRESEAP